MTMKTCTSKYETAEARWAGVGPYYAMFPAKFADSVIQKFTSTGDTIIDPFAGRGTSIFSAAIAGRHGIGSEINPVGWLYAATKLEPTERWRAEERVEEIGRIAARSRATFDQMHPFFLACFSLEVLRFLLTARRLLKWRVSVVDRTVMTLILIDLHGKRQASLSNQMRQTKSMSPNYAIRWWLKHNLRPRRVDPVDFLLKKIAWRFARGTPRVSESRVYLVDSTHRCAPFRNLAQRLAPAGAKLIFTSPPYLGVTNYHYDQWLRLWMLGGPMLPISTGERHRGKFCHPVHYRCLLQSSFKHAGERLAKDGSVYVRTDSRRTTRTITREVLQEIFPHHHLMERRRPVAGETQTKLFGNSTKKVGEIDFILTP